MGDAQTEWMLKSPEDGTFSPVLRNEDQENQSFEAKLRSNEGRGLKKMKKLLNVVLDLDGTLVTSTAIGKRSPQVTSRPEYYSNTWMTVEDEVMIMSTRPGVKAFLSWINMYFDVYVSTHATEEYAVNVLQRLGILQSVRAMVTRERKGNKLLPKTLARLGLDSFNSIIIDDRAKVWDEDANCCILEVPPFVGQEEDYALENVRKILNYVKNEYKGEGLCAALARKYAEQRPSMLREI